MILLCNDPWKITKYLIYKKIMFFIEESFGYVQIHG